MEDTVPFSHVLIVLQAARVRIIAVDPLIRRYILSKGSTLEEQTFTDPVGKRVLHYLARHFDIPVHFFWHPEMIVPEPGEAKH